MEEFGTAVEVEERISNARENYFDGNFASLRAAATKHHVPYFHLYARQHSRPSKVGRPGPNKRLNPEQEASLRLYIRRYDEIGYSAMPFMVYNAATCILEESRVDSTIPIRPLGRNWVLHFLAANPNIEKCIQKPKDKKRIDAQKCKQIEKIFQKIKKIHDEKGILPSDCWNFDETGFWIGCGGKQIVLTLGVREKPKKNRKSLIIASETNCDYLTSIDAISAAGNVISPMLILKVCVQLFNNIYPFLLSQVVPLSQTAPATDPCRNTKRSDQPDRGAQVAHANQTPACWATRERQTETGITGWDGRSGPHRIGQPIGGDPHNLPVRDRTTGGNRDKAVQRGCTGE